MKETQPVPAATKPTFSVISLQLLKDVTKRWPFNLIFGGIGGILAVAGILQRYFTYDAVLLELYIFFSALLISAIHGLLESGEREVKLYAKMNEDISTLKADNEDKQKEIERMSLLSKESSLQEESLRRDAFAYLHRAKRDQIARQSFEDKEVVTITGLKRACTCVKKYFDIRTGCNSCSVSIKILKAPMNSRSKNRLEVINVCRDEHSDFRNVDGYEFVKHYIVGNTPYCYIYESLNDAKRDKFYINQNVNIDRNYKSTSKKLHPNGELPYSSELVLPILPLKPLGKGANPRKDFLGFFCIDCASPDAFDINICPSIAQSIVDDVYDLFEPIIKREGTSSVHISKCQN